jgi:XTP/dITP diphosphohydrolase
MKKIVIASNNKGKIREFRQILSSYEVLSLADCNLNVDVEETGVTFEENALIKAKAIYEIIGVPVISDDSGLVVDALGGAPGVYSARYAGEEHNDEANNALLLKNLENTTNRNAKFVSAVVYYDGERTLVGKGEVNGTILHEKCGNGGFGYDPLFFSTELNKCFGQASAEEKNSVSHRYRAICDLVRQL